MIPAFFVDLFLLLLAVSAVGVCAVQLLGLLLLERQTGALRSANSAAPQGCVGAGYGVQNPMSPGVLPVPDAMAPAARNRAAWLSVSHFLATQNLRAVLAARAAAPATAGQACAARAGAAGAQALPVGNHGDNKHQQCPGTSKDQQ